MIRHRLSAILFASLLSVGVAAERNVSDTEVWNKAVEHYYAGDVTNALRLLRPLMVSKDYSSRAAEVVAKMEHERSNREEAAYAAQIALRAQPKDERVNRNFTRAIDALGEYRKRRHIDSVLKASKDKDPGVMLRDATHEVRRIMTESGVYRTNCAERVVAISDSLSRSAEKIADVWIPLREVIAGSVTNEEQAATILAQLDRAEEKSIKATKELADIDEAAYSSLSDVEHDFTRFLKMLVMPPAAIDEGLIAQSNAWLDVEHFNNRPWQTDSLDYTRAFRSKFPAWARAYEQSRQSDTNRPPFTAEAQAKISALATELEKIQLECTEKELPPEQERAIGIQNEIKSLLPKDSNNGNGGGNGSAGNQNKQNKNEDNTPKPESDQRQNEETENEASSEENPEEADGKEEKNDTEIESVLRRAQERNDEHEADKKARMRRSRRSPNERDW